MATFKYISNPTLEQIQAFKDNNRIVPGRTPAQLVFDSRRGAGDADAQPGGFYGGGYRNPEAAPKAAPPTAADAPTKGANNIFTGLADALNKYQKDLERDKPGYVADEYVFKFVPASIGAAKVTPPSKPVTYKNTAGQNIDTAQDKVDPDRNSVNTNSQQWNISAGTQIIQLIDQIVCSSTYITGQQTVTFDEDDKQVTNPKAGAGGVTTWFKISIGTEQLGYDKLRRDYAYRITYTVSEYAINQMCSVYFKDSKYRGAHKAYEYWFTGANTQIISYEQEYNHAYYNTLAGNTKGLAVAPPTGRDQMKNAVMATSEQRVQGQANYVNAGADNATAFLYSIADFAENRIKIVGDPAWMQQGEVAFGVNTKNFDFNPFNADGTINYDSQQVTYSVSFNQPTDYNFNTGIMNTDSGSGAPQATFTFQAVSCKNIFSKGQFFQEVTGVLIPLNNSAPVSTNNRPSAVTSSSGSRLSPRTAEQIVAEQNASFEYATTEGSEQTRMLAEQDAGLFDDPAQPPAPQPATPPGAPTSSGDLTPADVPAPQNASAPDKILANEEETAAVNAYIEAGGTFPRGTGPITSGPLFDNVVAAKATLTARQQASSVPATTSTPPQIMDKEY
jgi:hypothetical protein